MKRPRKKLISKIVRLEPKITLIEFLLYDKFSGIFYFNVIETPRNVTMYSFLETACTCPVQCLYFFLKNILHTNLFVIQRVF